MDYSAIEHAIGFTFQDKRLLQQALTHRSALNEPHGRGLSHNERLEFLGDAVLDLVVADYLEENFPDKDEGEMTSMRGFIVAGDLAAEAGIKLGLDAHMIIGKNELLTGSPRVKKSLISNALEALIGALYRDQGYLAARAFVDEILIAPIEGNVLEFKGAKCLLQERVQAQQGVTPHYKLLEEEGPDHDKVYTIGVFAGPNLIGKGVGKSKKEASQTAAQNALDSL